MRHLLKTWLLPLTLAAAAPGTTAVRVTPLPSVSGTGDNPVALIDDGDASAAFTLATAGSGLSVSAQTQCSRRGAVSWLTPTLDVGFFDHPWVFAAAAVTGAALFSDLSLAVGTSFLAISNTVDLQLGDGTTGTPALGASEAATFSTEDAANVASASTFTPDPGEQIFSGASPAAVDAPGGLLLMAAAVCGLALVELRACRR